MSGKVLQQGSAGRGVSVGPAGRGQEGLSGVRLGLNFATRDHPAWEGPTAEHSA